MSNEKWPLPMYGTVDGLLPIHWRTPLHEDTSDMNPESPDTFVEREEINKVSIDINILHMHVKTKLLN